MALELGVNVAGTTDENVKVSANDTTASKLKDKLLSVDKTINVKEENDGGFELLNIEVPTKTITDASPSQTLNINTTPVGTDADTSEKILATYTLPGNTLNKTGDGLRILGKFKFAATANTKTFAFKIGATVFSFTEAVQVNDKRCTLWWQIWRTGASAYTGFIQVANGDATTKVVGVALADDFEGVDDLTANQAIVMTGTNSVASANDIEFIAWTVQKISIP